MTRSKSKKNIKDSEEKIEEPVEETKENTDETEGLAWPSVVCVMVASDPLEWFDESLASIVNSEYPDLTTLVLDLTSDEEALKERLSRIAPAAFIRRFDASFNFASAVNDAINSIEGATYVLICHDDVVLKKGAITAMVQEAFRSNASMVGPKILDGDNPDCLLEVGGMIDRFGVPFSGIEEGEVDQSQHDGVRDVFYVSSAAMLVRADLYRALGGFDELCFPGAEDIDLSWRAHLVGARVLVQPDAAVAHHHISDSLRQTRTSARSIVAKHRMRAVLKNSSGISLSWIIPVSFLLHTIEGIFFLLRFNPKRSVILFRGWLWNIKNIKQLRKTRKEVQKSRVVSDRDISSHQIAGSARIRKFFNSITRNRQLKQFRAASIASIKTSREASTKYGPVYFGAFFLYLVALRNLIFGSVTSIGSFVKWGSFSDQMSGLFHGGLPTNGHASFASTVQRIISLALTTIFGFNPDLAQRMFVLSLIPIGVVGVHKLLKNFSVSPKAIMLGSIVYGLISMSYGIFEFGRNSVLLTIAVLPFFIDGLIKSRIRRTSVSAALIVAFNPASALILLVVGFTYILFGQTSSGLLKKIETLSIAMCFSLIVNIGLLYDLFFNIDRSAFGLNRDAMTISDYFFTNNLTRFIGIVIAGICAVAIILARGKKVGILHMAVISTAILCAFSAVLISLDETTIDVANIFVLGSIALALSSSYCVDAFTNELTKKSFGVFHFLNLISLLSVIVICAMQLPFMVSGTLDMSSKSWGQQIDVKNGTRIAYIGKPDVLGANPALLPGHQGLVISNSSDVTLSNSLVGPSNELDDDFRQIYDAVITNKTSHAGFLLSKLGISTIAIPSAASPDMTSVASNAQLLEAFDRQIDLVRIQDREGLVIYVNQTNFESFKNDQIVKNFNASNELEGKNEVTYAEDSQDVINYLVVFISAGFALIIILWPRRKELMSNAYTSVKKIQSMVGEDKVGENTKKKIESHEIDLVKEAKKELVIDDQKVDVNK